MSDEPTLPKLPLARSDTPRVGGSRRPTRIQRGTSPPVSSDPPLFSSDDDPSVENYSNFAGRNKRKFRGPWFDQQPQELGAVDGPRANKRTFQRHVDSGVWLGSDSSQDEDAIFSSEAQLNDGTRGVDSPLAIRQPWANARLFRPRPTSHPLPPSPEVIAERIIESCLEQLKEYIDLTCLDLTSLSNSTIKPLSTFISVAPSIHPVSYRPLTRRLQLFLSSNKLRRIPGEICNLEELVALSLRNNRLIELPAAIGRLRCLTELNIANNHLQHLPYEILKLVSDDSNLTRLIVHTNPFFRPTHGVTSHAANTDLCFPQKDVDMLATSREDEETSKDPRAWNNPLWVVGYKYRSQVRFFGKTGVLMKGPIFPRDDSLFSCRTQTRASHGSFEVPRAPPGDTATAPSPSLVVNGADLTRAPSLLELAVRKLSKSPFFLNFDYRFEGVPEIVADVLDSAKVLQEMEAGDRTCTICSKAFVIPRTEWIEWWEIARREAAVGATGATVNMEDVGDRTERVVPLMRRGCSWKCVPPPEPRAP